MIGGGIGIADMNQDGSIDIIFTNYESKNVSSSGRSVCHTIVATLQCEE